MQSLSKIMLVFIFTCTSVVVQARTDSNARETERYDSLVLSNTQIRKLHSDVTGVDYKLYINIPASYYHNRDKKYPVLYLLDADYSFPLAKQESEHLADRNRIEEVLIVGIAYDGPLNYRLNRTRDYTISHVPDGGYGAEFQKVSGGGDKFISFLTNELVPYIERSFPVTESRGLVGHSYGGLFANYSLLKAANVFDRLLVVSPSLWYDNEKIMKMAKNTTSFNQERPHRVYLAIGGTENGGHYKMVDELNAMTKIINNKPHKNLEVTSDVLQGFDHDTVFPAALSKGLVVLYG